MQLGRQFCVYNFVGTKNLSENKQKNNVQSHCTKQSRLAHASLLQHCSRITLSLHIYLFFVNVLSPVLLSAEHRPERRI